MLFLKFEYHHEAIKSIQDGADQKDPLSVFPSVTYTNIGISQQNILTFSFNPFATLVQNFKAIPSASPKLLNLNQDHPPPQKKSGFSRQILIKLRLW